MPPEEVPTPQAPLEPQQPQNPPSQAGSEGASVAAEPSSREVAEFAKHRRGLRAKAERLAAQQAQLKAERQAIEQGRAEQEQLKKELADLRTWREQREKGNPLDHVEDPSKVVREYVEKTAPERRIDLIEQENKKLRDEIAKFPKLLEERDQKAAQERAQQQEHIRLQNMAQERATFTRILRSRAAEFPYLHEEYDDAQIDAMTAEIQAWARKSEWVDEQGRKRIGRVVTFEDAAKFLNDKAKAVYESKQERRKLLSPGESKETPSGTERRDKKTPPGNGRRDERPAPATTPQKRKLTAAEEDERNLQMLRDAMQKDTMARNGAAKRTS